MSDLKEPDVKYVFFLTRDLCKNEKNELKKWFKVFNYSKETVNDRTITEVLDEYDVILINIFDSEHRQFFSENVKLLQNNKNILRVFVGKLKEDTKEERNEIIEQWNIDFFTKDIPILCDSKEQLLHKLLCVLLPKPKKKSITKIIFDGLIVALSYIIPKLLKGAS
jgi:hypothetical protein